MNRKENSPMPYHVLARLSPDVFSHPVWVQFIEAKVLFSQKLVEELLLAAQQLQAEGDFSSSCQVLFICTALQQRLEV